jgi:hypothetical protein
MAHREAPSTQVRCAHIKYGRKEAQLLLLVYSELIYSERKESVAKAGGVARVNDPFALFILLVRTPMIKNAICLH